MIPRDTPTPAAPTPTPTPAPNAAPTPGVDSGFSDYLKQKYPNGIPGAGGTTDIWGSEAGSDLIVRSSGSLHPNGKEPLMHIRDVMYQFWQRDQKWIDALAAKLVKAGFLPSVNVTRSDIWEAFRSNVLMEAASQYASNPTKAATTEQILQSYMKRPVGDAAEGEKKPAHFTIPTTSANISDPTEADSVFVQALQSRLGRAPTDAEKHTFLAALNAAQRAHPTVTNTQYDLDAKSGQYATSATTTGGVNANQFADDFTMHNNETEYGAYQAAGTLFDAMMGALGSPGGV